jgi:CRISPR/Cas system CMR-associated protein Cmr3 (group 5 of RAMP superfamily)
MFLCMVTQTRKTRKHSEFSLTLCLRFQGRCFLMIIQDSKFKETKSKQQELHYGEN